MASLLRLRDMGKRLPDAAVDLFDEPDIAYGGSERLYRLQDVRKDGVRANAVTGMDERDMGFMMAHVSRQHLPPQPIKQILPVANWQIHKIAISDRRTEGQTDVKWA